MAGSSEVTPSVFLNKLEFVLPGLVFGFIIYLAIRGLRHIAVLPVGILLVIVVFYIALWTTDTSVETATKHGWIRDMDDPPEWYETWSFLRLDKVVWGAFPRLLLTEIGMIFVVALSSSLDVAAIELEMGNSLDYNKELCMVGLSNVVSGVTGGYTGSYIFSQSIFSLRAGIRSRTAGYVLATCELIIIVLPFPVLAYIPNFFFGSLLSMLCIDLMYEWLWDVRQKITKADHLVCLSTFVLILILGVEYGILAGIAMFWVCQRLGMDVQVSTTTAEPHSTTEVTPLRGENSSSADPQYGTVV